MAYRESKHYFTFSESALMYFRSLKLGYCAHKQFDKAEEVERDMARLHELAQTYHFRVGDPAEPQPTLGIEGSNPSASATPKCPYYPGCRSDECAKCWENDPERV
jgi:hypothetical protein